MLEAPIEQIPTIGPEYAKKLHYLGIVTVQDLLFHFPHRYQDFAYVSSLETAQPGEVVTIKGQIISIKNIFTRTGKKIQTATVSDGAGSIEVTWFNQTYLVKNLPPGTWVSLSGKVQQFGKKRSLIAPVWERITPEVWIADDQETLHTGRLVPVYPETSGLSSKWIRTKIAKVLPQAIDQIQEFLPQNMRDKNSLMDIKPALEQIHFPDSKQQAEAARRRFAFNEFFELQLNALARKDHWKKKKVAHQLSTDKTLIPAFVKSLPFEPTDAQQRAINEIASDLAKNEAMNRLLEGDVGSGKTVLAAFACFVAHTNGFQSAIMAPTQILASQHYQTIQNILGPHGITVGLVTSEQTKKQKLENSQKHIIIGTHALIQHAVNFENLAVVVIDEQHRFGVKQRATLLQKGATKVPHVLTMTATPIPRTVALTMYGDLQLSVLDQLPKNRKRIKTWVVPPLKRQSAYEWIRKHVKDTDEQAFIVCPLIEESESETLKSVRAAKVEFEHLQEEVFPDLRLGLLHGKIKGEEKNQIMDAMKKGDIDILVATPVVEVGIDIPNATIMMIEASERFGLAQLHQLRGRVGRGDKQSYCLLFTNVQTQKTKSRLAALEKNLTGAELAELDLKLRGPGEIYGSLQSGFPELKIGSYTDLPLIKAARECAEELLPEVPKNKQLKHFLKVIDYVVPN